jgi:hypothetical protein
MFSTCCRRTDHRRRRRSHPGHDLYLKDRQGRHDQVRAENERRFDPQGIRDRLSSLDASTLPSFLSEKVLPQRSTETVGGHAVLVEHQNISPASQPPRRARFCNFDFMSFLPVNGQLTRGRQPHGEGRC